MQNVLFVGEHGLDSLEIAMWITTIQPRRYGVINSHYPSANDATIFAQEDVARVAGFFAVIVDALLRSHVDVLAAFSLFNSFKQFLQETFVLSLVNSGHLAPQMATIGASGIEPFMPIL